MTTMNDDIAAMKADYAKLIKHLRVAATIRKRINDEYGLDHDEMHEDLVSMIGAAIFEQDILASMLETGDVVDDPLLAIHEAARSGGEWATTKNDVTVSGVSDTTLLRQLDGRI